MYRLAKIVIIMLLIGTTGLSAQHYIGVRGGYGGGSARFNPSREMGYEWGLYNGGLSYKYYSETKYVGAVQTDVQFMQRGFKYDQYSKSDTSYHRKINSVDIPIMWQPHVYLFNRNARFFVNLGVQFSYNMSSEYWIESKEKGIIEKGEYPFKVTRDNRLGYGLCGGAGLSVFMGRVELAVEGRYYFGYSDILRSRTKYKDTENPNPLRSPLDNMNVSVALYYRLGKGGIKAAPSVSMARKMEEKAMKRQLKLENKRQKSLQDE